MDKILFDNDDYYGDIVHKIWIDAMKGLLSKMYFEDDSVILPYESYLKMWGQMETPYIMLSDEDKKTDVDICKKYKLII